jgi:hypothetical protein
MLDASVSDRIICHLQARPWRPFRREFPTTRNPKLLAYTTLLDQTSAATLSSLPSDSDTSSKATAQHLPARLPTRDRSPAPRQQRASAAAPELGFPIPAAGSAEFHAGARVPPDPGGLTRIRRTGRAGMASSPVKFFSVFLVVSVVGWVVFT